jgi:hypothetical protein
MTQAAVPPRITSAGRRLPRRSPSTMCNFAFTFAFGTTSGRIEIAQPQKYNPMTQTLFFRKNLCLAFVSFTFRITAGRISLLYTPDTRRPKYRRIFWPMIIRGCNPVHANQKIAFNLGNMGTLWRKPPHFWPIDSAREKFTVGFSAYVGAAYGKITPGESELR